MLNTGTTRLLAFTHFAATVQEHLC